MTKKFLKRQLEHELKELEKAKEFLQSTEGNDGYATCSGSEELGYRKGRVDLIRSLLGKET
jgi:hypothetical protein